MESKIGEVKTSKIRTSRLETLVGVIAGSIPFLESLFYRNSALNTTSGRLIDTSKPLIYDRDVTPYVGNWAESFAVPLASGLIWDFIEIAGKKRGSKFLEKLGRYFPEIDDEGNPKYDGVNLGGSCYYILEASKKLKSSSQ